MFLPADILKVLPTPLVHSLTLLQQWNLLCQVSTRDWRRPLGGRLQYFRQAWEYLTSDPWVLNAVSGLALDLTFPPHQRKYLPDRSLSVSEEEAVSSEVASLLSKGAIHEVRPGRHDFRSSIFVVPKEGGKLVRWSICGH